MGSLGHTSNSYSSWKLPDQHNRPKLEWSFKQPTLASRSTCAKQLTASNRLRSEWQQTHACKRSKEAQRSELWRFHGENWWLWLPWWSCWCQLQRSLEGEWPRFWRRRRGSTVVLPGRPALCRGLLVFQSILTRLIRIGRLIELSRFHLEAPQIAYDCILIEWRWKAFETQETARSSNLRVIRQHEKSNFRPCT